MWIIGLLLLAAAIVVGVDISINNDQSIDLEAFNHVWTSTPAVAFGVGVVTALVGMVGLLLFFGSLHRMKVRREERRAEAEERDRLAAERDRLADERRREIDAMSTANQGTGGRMSDERDVRDERDPAFYGDRGDRDMDREDRERVADRERMSDRDIDRDRDVDRDRDIDRERVARNDDTIDVRDRDEVEPRERHGILHRR